MTKKLFILCIVLSLNIFFAKSCSKGPNPEKINKVLVIGNSITQHHPAPKIGWSGDWGMAASSASKDYVHQLISKIHSKNKKVVVKIPEAGCGPIFERVFWEFDTLDFKEHRDFDADLILLRLGENVRYQDAEKYDLVDALNRLVNYVNKDKKAIVCCTNRFWPNEIVDQKIVEFCQQNNYPLISLAGIFDDKTNTAADQFEDIGVGAHPSDKGMEIIADRIWEQLQKYF